MVKYIVLQVLIPCYRFRSCRVIQDLVNHDANSDNRYNTKQSVLYIKTNVNDLLGFMSFEKKKKQFYTFFYVLPLVNIIP